MVYEWYTSTMALNIKNPRVERLAEEVAEMTGETKTQAILQALAERRDRLALRLARKGPDDVLDFLRREIWSEVPEDLRGKALTKRETERILGYGRDGA